MNSKLYNLYYDPIISMESECYQFFIGETEFNLRCCIYLKAYTAESLKFVRQLVLV